MKIDQINTNELAFLVIILDVMRSLPAPNHEQNLQFRLTDTEYAQLAAQGYDPNLESAQPIS
ncbi:hypothetical protein H6G80_35825 [Nostoc sp. FACHB-87]|uniref:hypothetical protein n=1 Tax=Nostocaceae TaxID=1162 RepID=UPI001688F227|nr:MULTISPECIES: hypothetical protein [Nostocaceae]MBD2459380.1 hypothetical protein [Nostoc sp. FACHB-87]MBD2480372.1 hypothetical protein [Anabaena sp. FACHB-83]